MCYCRKCELICIFCVGETMSLNSLERMPTGRWQAAHFLLASLSYEVMGVPVCLLRESRCARLVRVAGRWTKPPLSARVAPIAGSSYSFVTLDLPRMISCAVYEWPPHCPSDDISCRVPDTNYLIWPFHHVLHVNSTLPCLLRSRCLSILVKEMAHGDDRGKCPRDKSYSPPPDDNGGGRPLGVCGGKVGIQPFLATGERVSYCDVSNADNS
jgi:hypothetical protein